MAEKTHIREQIIEFARQEYPEMINNRDIENYIKDISNDRHYGSTATREARREAEWYAGKKAMGEKNFRPTIERMPGKIARYRYVQAQSLSGDEALMYATM